MPHLDFDLQRFGPDSSGARQAASDVDSAADGPVLLGSDAFVPPVVERTGHLPATAVRDLLLSLQGLSR